MERSFVSQFKRFDFWLVAIVSTLIIIGLSTINSSIVAGSSVNTILNHTLIQTQLLAVVIGVIVIILLSSIPYEYMSYVSWLLYMVSIVLLIAVLFLGEPIRGAIRWIQIGTVPFQPSTVSIVLLIIVFASYFSRIKEQINTISYFALSLLMMIIPVLLIAIEPDLGSALLLFIIWMVQLFITPLKFRYIALVALILVIAAPIVWVNIETYQQSRIVSFINPTDDPLGAGYNLVQSIIAVGSGQLFGRGWGRGTQSHLQYLPEQHTDFVFATFAEEQGFIGVSIVLILYAGLAWRIIHHIRFTKSYLGQSILIGMLTWYCIHIFVNIGMNIGIAPITGLPLPFMSYGGTSIVTALITIGIIESVAINRSDW